MRRLKRHPLAASATALAIVAASLVGGTAATPMTCT